MHEQSTDQSVSAQDKQQTFPEYIESARIGMDCLSVSSNPNMGADPEWNKTAAHWSCNLYRIGPNMPRMLTFFSQGPAYKGKPSVSDVLSCLASDSASIEQANTFEEWAADLGYSDDSRQAERTYNICLKQAAKLKTFLGSDFDHVLYELEPY